MNKHSHQQRWPTYTSPSPFLANSSFYTHTHTHRKTCEWQNHIQHVRDKNGETNLLSQEAFLGHRASSGSFSTRQKCLVGGRMFMAPETISRHPAASSGRYLLSDVQMFFPTSAPRSPQYMASALNKWCEGSCCCSVTQWCLTLRDPRDCSVQGFPVHHHLLEFAQTHVHRVSDATQPSHWKLVEWNDCNPVGLSASFGTHLLIKYIQTSKMLLRTEGQWSELRGRDHGCGSWCGRRKTAQPLPGSLPLEHLSPISLHSFQPSWGLFPFCLLLISCIGPCWGRLAVL